MKRFIVLGLSVLTLSLAAATSVKAGQGDHPYVMAMNFNTADTVTDRVDNTPQVGRGNQSIVMAMNSNAINTGITPFELVFRAYQGGYTAQGIHSFGSLHTDFSSGRLTAKNLVQAAIDAKELAPEVSMNSSYINAVELQLNTARQ